MTTAVMTNTNAMTEIEALNYLRQLDEALAQTVIVDRALPKFESSPYVSMRLYFDGQLVASYRKGLAEFETTFDPDYRPKIFKVEFDDQLVFVSVQETVLLDRVPQAVWKEFSLNF